MPARFASLLRRTWPRLIRAKRHFWLATRPGWAAEVSLAGGLLLTEGLGRWWCEAPRKRWPDDEDLRRSMEEHRHPVWSDRRQELVFIGREMDEAAIRDALDAVPAADLPDFAIDGTLAAITPAVRREIAASRLGPAWLADWLAASAAFLARLLGELAGVEHARLRLETIADNACERFHVDNVRLRLLCTYRGPGTEWLDPKRVANAPADEAVPHLPCANLERGAVALIRGSRDPARPGLLHRSPPLAGTGIVRLLLVIDEAR